MIVNEVRSFLEYFEKIRGRTLRVAQAIPDQRMEWAPAPNRFSFGDILRHLGATERYMFVENALRRPSRYPGHDRSLADGYDAVFAYLERMHRESVELLAKLRDEDLEEKCTTPGGVEIRVGKWLRAMVEHEVHHRGQLYTYLAILDVATPPLYGLTSEEVAARSRP